MPAGITARQLDGILVGVRSTQGEQDFRQRAVRGDIRHSLARQGADPGCHPGRGVREFRGLRLHGFDHAFVSVTDIDAHGHRVEVQVALFIHVPEINAFGALHRDRVHL